MARTHAHKPVLLLEEPPPWAARTARSQRRSGRWTGSYKAAFLRGHRSANALHA